RGSADQRAAPEARQEREAEAMKRLGGVPIKRKLSVVTMLTCCLSLLLASIALGVYDRAAFRQTLVENLRSTAQMVDENIASALEFRDRKSAAVTLQSLVAHPHIVSA